MNKKNKYLEPHHEIKWELVIGSLLAIGFIIMLLFGCTSKHIQKSEVKTDSVVVKKVDSVRIRRIEAAKQQLKNRTQVKKDNTKKKEVVKETTVIEFDNGTSKVDTGASVGKNGTADEYAPTGKIKRITHTKTTTKQVNNNTIDSTVKNETVNTQKSEIDSSDHHQSDSTNVSIDASNSNRTVIRISLWWLLLLIIPFGLGIYVYRKSKKAKAVADAIIDVNS